MSKQLHLLFALSIQERFERYHQEHPEVQAQLIRFAEQMKESGMKRCGIALLFERLRWFYWVERSDQDFKLNNDFRSRYARQIMELHPEFSDFFELRELRSE